MAANIFSSIFSTFIHSKSQTHTTNLGTFPNVGGLVPFPCILASDTLQSQEMCLRNSFWREQISRDTARSSRNPSAVVCSYLGCLERLITHTPLLLLFILHKINLPKPAVGVRWEPKVCSPLRTCNRKGSTQLKPLYSFYSH